MRCRILFRNVYILAHETLEYPGRCKRILLDFELFSEVNQKYSYTENAKHSITGLRHHIRSIKLGVLVQETGSRRFNAGYASPSDIKGSYRSPGRDDNTEYCFRVSFIYAVRPEGIRVLSTSFRAIWPRNLVKSAKCESQDRILVNILPFIVP